VFKKNISKYENIKKNIEDNVFNIILRNRQIFQHKFILLTSYNYDKITKEPFKFYYF